MRKYLLNCERGSVLLTVTWILAFLAIFTVIVNRHASQQLVFGQWMKDRILLRSLAGAGIDRAVFQIQQDPTLNFDALNEKWASYQEAFKSIPAGEGTISIYCPRGEANPNDPNSGPLYGACDEASRININFASRQVLIDLFRRVIEKPDEKRLLQIAESIIDWRDSDDAILPDGAEDSYYRSLPNPYRPRNGFFESVEELSMVKGMDKTLMDEVKPYITVYTNGKVNMNSAGSIILEALGFNRDIATRIVTARWGGDAVEGTADDSIFQDASSLLDEIAAKIELTQEEREAVSSVLVLDTLVVRSDYFRIYSLGKIVKPRQTLEQLVMCVINRNGSILSWQEGGRL